MENQETYDDTSLDKMIKTRKRGKIMGGLLMISIGALFLAKELGAQIPEWIFTWKILLISIGAVIAVKHKFRHPGWIVLMGVGGAFLLNDIYPDLQIKPFLWPAIFIFAGLFMMFKPRRRQHDQWKKWHEKRHQFRQKYEREVSENAYHSDEEGLESISIMGGSKKIIINKKFKGGEIVNVFGGTYLDLTQADFEKSITLEITQVFGGTKLIVPANWEIKSETVAVCGAIEDKRTPTPNLTGEESKVLVIIGTTVFGGIEIKSFD